ncbi:kinase-like domain-containing protein, partial [Mycena rebaudengoi]
MPTPPLPYKCGSPGCDRKFEKPEYLRQHTKDSHSPSKPLPKQPTFKCGVVGCQAKPFPQLSLLHQHTKDSHSSPKPPPKDVFKCGVKGCNAASFSQLLLLHEHTAVAHPKSYINTPSGSSTSAFSTQGGPIAYLPTVGQAHYVPPYVYPRQSVQDDVSNIDYVPATPATPPLSTEEMLLRLMQLELRQMVIDKSTLKVGVHFVELAEQVILSSTNDRRISFCNRLQERVEWMSKHNKVCSLAYSGKFRAEVRTLLRDFGYNDSIKIEKAFLEDDQVILHLFREVIYSSQEEIVQLSDERATGFMDALSKCITANNDPSFLLSARRLLKNLCASAEVFPPSLFLELDSVDTNRQIGRGGFADIFLGRYKGQDVALKRLQVYRPESNEILEFSQSLLQEVLAWVHLKHIYVLPFLGLDKQSFEGYPPCIITPFMRNGTMKDFVKNRRGTLTDKQVDLLLFETAQGLAYLHSQNIVHGDLRGGNVFIDSAEHAQLADFGLAVVTDATIGTTSTAQHGSLRWMVLLAVVTDATTDTTSTTWRGSSRWMAPELLNHELEFKRTRASDVYAFACLCVEIYTGEQPFWNFINDMAAAFQIVNGKRPPRPSSLGPPDGTRAMSDELWAIVEACWAHEPSDRPDMDKVSELILINPNTRAGLDKPSDRPDMDKVSELIINPNARAGLDITLNEMDCAGESGSFVIYSYNDIKTERASFTANDLTAIQTSLSTRNISCLMSVHEPGDAVSWIEENWNSDLLDSIRNSDCGGPLPWMLSPEESSLAIFGSYRNPTVVGKAQALAELSGFPVVIRPPGDNPVLTLINDAEPRSASDDGTANSTHKEKSPDGNDAANKDEDTPERVGNSGGGAGRESAGRRDEGAGEQGQHGRAGGSGGGGDENN